MSGTPKPRAFKKPGHFIGADACRFFRHHHVGRYCVSTIGDYHPRSRPEAEWEPLGYYTAPGGETRPARYETCVFDIRAKQQRWVSLEMKRCEDEMTAKAYHATLLDYFTSSAIRQARRRAAEVKARIVVVPPKGKVGVVTRRSRRGRGA